LGSSIHTVPLLLTRIVNSNAGGGGERVLWTVVALLQRTSPDIVSVVYSGDGDAGKEEIISKVKSRFNITLRPESLHFVFLKSRNLVEDSSWPRFTILGQSIGSMVLAWEGMSKLIPDIYIDTMGYAFSFHVVRWLSLGRVPMGAYVHYPTISTDMLARVKSRKQSHTNTGTISSSATLSQAKLLYYRIFMYLYSGSLRRVRFLMANSSWTKNHVDSVLNHRDGLLDFLNVASSIAIPVSLLNLFGPRSSAPKSATIVYPPCETQELVGFDLKGRENIILSVAQFRPEKDHAAQLRAVHELFSQHPEYRSRPVKLVLIGGARGDEDGARVVSLRSLAGELEISDNVEFIVNASHEVVLSYLARASIGLSTMVDEHFGINVVEFMAAGMLPITHASGGPLNDIVVPFNGDATGYHATSSETFAIALNQALSMPPDSVLAMRNRARAWAVHQFSREGFERDWEASGWRDFVR